MPKQSTEKDTVDALKSAQFVTNVVKNRMSQGKAYALTQGRTEPTRSDYVSGSRMMRKEDVQALMQTMRHKYVQDAETAYNQQWELAASETTPPHVKMGFYKEVQDRAGLGGIDYSVKHETKYQDLDMTKEQLRQILDEV